MKRVLCKQISTEEDGETTTVGELITALQQFAPDKQVFTEGCDCYGDVVSVVLQDGYVLIERSS